MPVALRAEERWSPDFLTDTFGVSRRFRIFAVHDDCCRENLCLIADTSIREARVARELRALVRAYWQPFFPTCDGPECAGHLLDQWAYQRGVTLDFSRLGKLTDNAFIEAFNGRFCAECLNQHWFLTFADAADELEAWRRYYNEERPHSAIGNKVPIMLTKLGGVTSLSP